MTDRLSIPQQTTGLTIIVGKGSERKTFEFEQSANHRNDLADIIFVFDTTGSMDTKIEALLASCSQFVTESQKLNLDINFALISFGDILNPEKGDKIIKEVDLTSDISEIKRGLQRITKNCGFGNLGESSFEAIYKAFEIKCRNKAVKSLILITDEPAHMQNIKSYTVIEELIKREYLTFVIATNERYYKEMAEKTCGIWKEISAHTKFEDILKIFQDLAKKVTEISNDVLESGGSVSGYIAARNP
jgi:Mg-chelatase subunit ChlD